MFKEKPSFNRWVVLSLTLLTFAAATSLVMRAGSASAPRTPPSRSEARVHEPSEPITESAPIIRVWVHPDDIYPDSVRVKAGRALLMAENERTTDISLVVERVIPGQSNQAVASIAVSTIAKRAGAVLDVSKGEYVFYELTRPDLIGTIIVDP